MFPDGAGARAVERLFARVYALLEPGGVFIFDTRLPEGSDLTLNDDYALWSEYPDTDGKPAQFWVKQVAYDAEQGVLHYEMKDIYADGRVVPSSEALKFTPLEALLSLAQHAGFEVAHQYGNWDLAPLPERAASGVLEFKKP